MGKKKEEQPFDALQVFCNLSRKLENSKNAMLSILLPNFYTKPNFDEGKEEDFDNNSFPLGRRKRNTGYNFKKSELPGLRRQLSQFAEFAQLDNVEALLLVALYTKQIESDNTVDVGDVTNYLSLSSIDFIPLRRYFDSLCEKGVLVRSAVRRSNQYRVDQTLANAINCNSKYERIPVKELDRYDFCGKVSDAIELRSNDDICTRDLVEIVKDYERRNSDMEFVSSMLGKPSLDIMDRILFYECCDDFVNNPRYHRTDIECTLNDIYDQTRDKMKVARQIMDASHALIESGLVDKTEATFFAEASIFLTDEGQKLFLGTDFELFSKQKKDDKNFILPDQIPQKKMFYSADLQKQIEFIRANLMEDKFHELQTRMESNGFSKGVAIMLYGMPGTGKTETVKQISKATGRKIYHVDISASKSCWFGESEKIVKRIFTNYREMCKNEDVTPILLFNEADALFSKRQEVGRSNLAQTENAIQNIILEEMENLEGILIATTNLTDNLDPAFERRFIFKVKFDQPTVEAKKDIWKSKVDWLSDEDCRKLATKYDFSGGEIDNVVRKMVMEEVLHGNRPDFSFIDDLCKNEKISKSKMTRVGF